MLSDRRLRDLARQIARVPGVVGVLLGGSRARGDHASDSDVDLGLYYRRPLDVSALQTLAGEIAGSSASVTALGEWGPWVDGGGWLEVEDTPVDWIYRDLDRVHDSWRHAREGRVDFAFQVGHPLGIPPTAYAGEVALGVVLADPTEELTVLQSATRQYPPALGEAFVDRLWEADFLLGVLTKPARRGDTAYVAGVLFRVVELCAYALYGHARRWVVNEKGAVAGAGRLPGAPAGFADRAHALLGSLGTTPAELDGTLKMAGGLLDDVRVAVGRR